MSTVYLVLNDSVSFKDAKELVEEYTAFESDLVEFEITNDNWPAKDLSRLINFMDNHDIEYSFKEVLFDVENQ